MRFGIANQTPKSRSLPLAKMGSCWSPSRMRESGSPQSNCRKCLSVFTVVITPGRAKVEATDSDSPLPKHSWSPTEVPSQPQLLRQTGPVLASNFLFPTDAHHPVGERLMKQSQRSLDLRLRFA